MCPIAGRGGVTHRLGKLCHGRGRFALTPALVSQQGTSHLRPSRNHEKIGIDVKCSRFAEGTPLSFQQTLTEQLRRVTAGTGGHGSSRIHQEHQSAIEANVLRVVPDAASEPLVVRMVGVLLLSDIIEVIGIAVRPRRHIPTAITADEPQLLSHRQISLRRCS